jgi:hypothetical protein
MDKGSRKRIQIVKVENNRESFFGIIIFQNLFEVKCGTSGMAIGFVLSQKEKHVSYFSEKWNDAK